MNVDFVNPFLESIINVLGTMANTEARPGKPFLKVDKSAKGDVSSIIGLVGEKAKGSMAITFTEQAILHIASQMLGEVISEVNDTASDCSGEITNMVTGGAKRVLADKGYHFDMAIPSTIVGKNHTITHKTSGRIVCIPFDTHAGSFFIEVCF